MKLFPLTLTKTLIEQCIWDSPHSSLHYIELIHKTLNHYKLKLNNMTLIPLTLAETLIEQCVSDSPHVCRIITYI